MIRPLKSHILTSAITQSFGKLSHLPNTSAMITLSLPIPDTISPTTLTDLIARHLGKWQVFWLNDDGNPVIGILPKVSWTLLPAINGTAKKNTLTLHQKNRVHFDYTCQKLACTYQDYQTLLTNYHVAHSEPCTNTQAYYHGLMGYVSYDITAHALNPSISYGDTPCAYFGHYDYYLTYDNGWQLHSLDSDAAAKTQCAKITKLLALLPFADSLTSPDIQDITPRWSKKAYALAFASTINYLNAGDAYQMNLTQAFDGKLDTALSAYLPSLYAHTKAPFSGYTAIDTGQGVFEILSVSPELFVLFDYKKGTNQTQSLYLTAKPIKGTRPRGQTPQQDIALKNELKTSEKDLAENVMIVDLLRNDLGKYAKFGKVAVPVCFDIETFSNVHHMVSTVEAELNNTPALTVLFDSLPAGSITGSPKKRACEIIQELEIAPRGAYCGTMGYLNFDSTGRFNVLIRTLQAQSSKLTLWAGGGITVLSDCDQEYQECLDKISHIRTILANPKL